MQSFQAFIDAHKEQLKQNQKLYAFFWGLPLYRKTTYCVNNRLKQHISQEGLSRFGTAAKAVDMFLSLWVYGCSYAEYNLYGFRKLKHRDRQKFIGDCCRKRYYAKFNAMSDTDCLRNKSMAYEEFKEYYGRQATVFYVSEGFERFCEIVKVYGTAMVKPVDASGGYGVMKVDYVDSASLKVCFDAISSVSASGEIFIEEYVEQNPELKALHPFSLNTARIITVLDHKGDPHILGTFFRVGRDGKVVDNGASGGLLCKLSEDGTIVRCMNKNGSEFIEHPDTKHQLVGFTIPQWDSAKQLARTLAMRKPLIRFCGWDLALSDKGWIMIEGNEASEFIGIQIFGDGCKDQVERYL